MVSCDTRISGSPANWTFSMALICSGDQRSASRAWTQPRSRSFPASFAVFGRRARNSACACAATARYPPCRGLLRRISRLTVDGARPSRAAITRSGSPAATPTAISSRSATDRYRPPAGPGPLPFTPPAARNQASAAPPPPAATAASRHGSPARTASQKTSRSARGTGSRPRLTNTTTSTISRNRCNHQLNPPNHNRLIINGLVSTRASARPQQWNSVSVLLPSVPTAQKPPPVGTAATPYSQLSPGPTLGLAIAVHEVPFQCSASVLKGLPKDVRRLPTAHAFLVPVAAAACSEL